jgi:hypothetical protein
MNKFDEENRETASPLDRIVSGQMEWTDVPPSVPGRYLWTMFGKFEVFVVTEKHDGELVVMPSECNPVNEWDGWWIGPLPVPKEFIIPPRFRESHTAIRPRRLAIRQDQLVRLARGESIDESPSLIGRVPAEYLYRLRLRHSMRVETKGGGNCADPTAVLACDAPRLGSETKEVRRTRLGSRLLSACLTWGRSVFFPANIQGNLPAMNGGPRINTPIL